MAMMDYDDGSKRGYSCHYKDGEVETNLTYVESLMRFAEAEKTDNPCTVRPPGYGTTEYNAP